MKLFTCQKCGNLLHFENSVCLRCDAPLGFLPDRLTLSAYDVQPDGSFAALAEPGPAFIACGNAATGGCNWLVRADSGRSLCEACDVNRTIPDLHLPENVDRWREIEAAKRRLIYALRRLRLPLTTRQEDVEHGLAFDFLADQPDEPVMTGHDDGLITINIAEADSAERERRRVELGEPYRTLLGHLRHEVGHYYWNELVQNGGQIFAARAVFGDEREDYGEALERHYENGPPADWQAGYVSAYATMHPWEDFAETWTHYLHMVDTLDTAGSFGMAIDPTVTRNPEANAEVGFDPYNTADFDLLVEAWIPLTVAVNSLNRSMGQPDFYPFALSQPAIAKLGFIHDLVRGASSSR
jgi:hypothetical protein